MITAAAESEAGIRRRRNGPAGCFAYTTPPKGAQWARRGRGR